MPDTLVLGRDRRLWLEHEPFGGGPLLGREYIDKTVGAFQFVDIQIENVLVLGTDGNLWLEHPPNPLGESFAAN
jgi:hypothetical protein